ncbi:caspase, EACC1-associated type [Glycomyces paridis]|uniref:Caspase family protein n=1 Tax=Glycomyces paridis TaxID=2126555 RepID=A0A4S8P0N0_9ACTN|nr:hypothetical protein [Glycomyces paridis]THV23550.1 hypothetical protein E9998_22390 [Glycomyces paridis]
MTSPLPPHSQAFLVGVSSYDHVDLPPIQPALNSLKAMDALLTDPGLGRWPRNRVETVQDPPLWIDLALRFKETARRTTGVLLLYYVGHGVIAHNGSLCLTVRGTRPDEPRITGLAWEHVAEAFTASPARVKIAILDCCFAGRAIESLSGNQVGPLEVKGVYTLTATSANRTAHTPADNGACTSFTGTLRDLLHEGIPSGRTELTFADLYPLLEARLREKGLPLPNQCNTATAADFPLTLNRSVAPARPPAVDTAEEPDDRDGARAAHIARLLDQTLKIASDLGAYGPVAPLVVAADPEQTQTVRDGLARCGSPDANALPLAAMSAALAGNDDDLAEALAADVERHFHDGHGRPSSVAMAAVAGVLLAHDGERAMRLVDHLVRIGRDADGEPTRRRAEALAAASRVFAAVDLDKSGALAKEAEALYLADPYLPLDTQTQVLQAIAFTRPGQAAGLADAIFLDFSSIVAGADQLAIVARRFPSEAMTVAQHGDPSPFKPAALARVAGALPEADRPLRPGERLEVVYPRVYNLFKDAQAAVDGIADPEAKVRAAAEVIPAFARYQSDSARKLYRTYMGTVAEIRDPDARARAMSVYQTALASIAGGMTGTDLEGAIRLARSIPDLRARALALASVAKELAAGRLDPDRGRRER